MKLLNIYCMFLCVPNKGPGLVAVVAALVIDLSLPQMHSGILAAANILLNSSVSFKHSFLSHAHETVLGHRDSFATAL